MARRANKREKPSSATRYLIAFKQGTGYLSGDFIVTEDLENAKKVGPKKPKKNKKKEQKEGDVSTNSFVALQHEITNAIFRHRSLDPVMSMLDVTRMDLHFFFSVKPLLEKYAEKSFEDQHRTIYSFDRSHLRDIISSLRNAQLGASGIRQLPRLLLIGLVSEYDVFLHKLIRAGIASQEGLVARIDRSLSLKELAGFSTIREASEFLIEREIDAILYEDHLDQIRALNKLDLLPLNAPSFG